MSDEFWKMKRAEARGSIIGAVAAVVVIALLFLLSHVPANAQLSGGLQFPGPGTAHSAGSSLSAVELVTNSGGTTTQTLSITTSAANTLIVVFTQVNDTTVSGVSGSVSGSFGAARASQFSGGVSTVYEHALLKASAGSETITITYAGTASFSIATAVGITGMNTSVPFDTDASLPAKGVSAASTVYSTTANDTLVFSAAGVIATAETGWTDLHNEAFWVVRCKVFSAPQSSQFVPYSGTANPVITDAVKP